MAITIILGILLLAGPLAALLGADSRRYDERDPRGWWPGTPHSRT